MTANTVNLYLLTRGIKFTKAPSRIRSKEGVIRYYDPLGSVTNGKTRLRGDYKKDNTPVELELVETACHISKVLQWHLHHLHAVSKGGSCNVANLCITPVGLNVAISNYGWTLDQINEFIAALPPFARESYGIPEGFKALPLAEGVRQAWRWVTPEMESRFWQIAAC